jgi:ATP-dependent DNA ligase
MLFWTRAALIARSLVILTAISAFQRPFRAVRFPRMALWRHDKRAEDADRIETVKALLG